MRFEPRDLRLVVSANRASGVIAFLARSFAPFVVVFHKACLCGFRV